MRLMHSMLVLCLILTSVSAFSSEHSKNKFSESEPNSKSMIKEETSFFRRDQRDVEREKNMRSSYGNAKQRYLKRSAQMASLAGIDPIIPPKTCYNESSSLGTQANCKIKEYSQKTKHVFHAAKISVSSRIEKSSFWFESLWRIIKGTYKSVERKITGRTNLLPHAGGLFFERRGEGAQPLYAFSTDEEMGDDDGYITKVEYNFDNGVIMTIPINEINSWADMDHVFPEEGTYNVSLRIYDDQDEYTEYTQTINVTDSPVSLNNFSYAITTGNSVNFTGSANNPAVGFWRYRWNFGDGTGNFTGSGLINTSHTFANPGVYNVTFQAWDNEGGRARITKKVYVNESVPSTAPPYAILRMNKNFGEGPLTVSFDAGLSVAQDDTGVNYYFDFGDFESVDNYSESATPSHTYKHPGTYYGFLRVIDSNGNSTDKSFRIFVSNGSATAPMIHAYQNGDSREFAFDGADWALTTTADDSLYFWDFDDSNSAVGAGTVHAYSSDGTYDVELVVHNVQGVRHVLNKTIDVTEVNDSPSVELSYPQVIGSNQATEFSAAWSQDPQEEEELTYTWNMGDGTVFSGTQYEVVNHTYTTPGFYPLRLTVTNTRGISVFRHGTVTVQDSYLQSEINYSPKSGPAPLTVDFDSDLSAIQTGTIVKHVWQFSDFTGSDSATTTKTYDLPGTYWVKLYIKDSAGNESVNYREVTVFDGSQAPPNNQPPIAVISKKFDGTSGRNFIFDASSSSDADGSIKYYEWTVDDQPRPDGIKLFQYFEPGTHTVKLTVVDVWGARASITEEFKTGDSTIPVLGFDFSPGQPITNTTTYFAVDANTLLPGVPLYQYNYSWDFGDGSPVEIGTTAQHTYVSAGSYIVTLSTPGINDQPYIKTMTVVVEDVVNPVVGVRIRDTANTQEVTSEQTYNSIKMPESIVFTAMTDSESQSSIVDADWTFGDGSTGFGINATHTYHKLGSYTVTVTGYDKNGLSDTSTATVVIPEESSCPSEEGSDACLRLNNAQGNVLPFSESSWVISHSLGAVDISTTTPHTPPGWITLTEVDSFTETPTVIDLSDIVTINGDQIEISKSGLVGKSIDLAKSYRLYMQAHSTANDPLVGDMPKLYFGAGAITINTTEEDVRIVMTQSSAKFDKYIKLGRTTTVTAADLPFGSYVIVASKEGRSDTYTVDVTSTTPAVVNVDLDPLKLSLQHEKKLQKMKTDRQRVSANKQNTKNRNLGNVLDAPDACGNYAPFHYAEEYVPYTSDYEVNTATLNNDSPLNMYDYRPIPSALKESVGLYCTVYTQSLDTSFRYWEYEKSTKECQPNYYSETSFPSFLAQHVIPFDNIPITIRYRFRDGISGQTIIGDINTSAQELRDEEGLTLQNVTYAKGVNNGLDRSRYGYYLKRKIEVPQHFKKPEMSFEMITAPYLTVGFEVTCQVPTPTQPVIEELLAANDDTRSVEGENAIASLDPAYNGFPVQYDGDQNHGPLLISPLIFVASYDLIVHTPTGTLDWDDVKVTMRYGTQAPKIIFSGTYPAVTLSPKKKKFKILLNAQSVDIGTKINWEPGIKKVTLEFQGMKNGAPQGAPHPRTFNALFDVKYENTRNLNSICSNEWYSENRISAYGRDSLLAFLKTMATPDGLGNKLGVRCNDMALPFASGEFKWPGDLKGHTGHNRGVHADIRYFNETKTKQDEYDNDFALGRIEDVETYLEFSGKALEIANAQSTDLDLTNFDKKVNLALGCRALDPSQYFGSCNDTTTSSDIDHDIVLKACQWYDSVDGINPTSCPDTSGYKEAIKRYSTWLKMSHDGLTRMALDPRLDEVLITYGFFSSLQMDWQKLALFSGRWPPTGVIDEPIYQVEGTQSGDKILPELISSCFLIPSSTCLYTSELRDVPGHLHHMHITVKE